MTNSNTPRSRGRRRGAKGRKAMVQKIAHEKRIVKLDGKTTNVTVVEALVLVAIARASKGDLRAYETVLDLQDKFADQTVSGAGYLLVPEPISPEQWIAEQMEANQHRQRPLLPHELAQQGETHAKAEADAQPIGKLTLGDLAKRK